jgi:DNA-binding Xre family transcriptional regulator
MIWGMIQTRLHEIAAKFDIKNAYQFQKFTGVAQATAYGLWKKDWTFVNLKTLNTLCNLFSCTPSDLLDFTPDPEEG